MATQKSRSSRPGTTRGDEAVRTVRSATAGELAYTEYGPASGTPVVWFHGTPGSRRLGSLFEAAATDCGVRLLAFDRPGYGRSPPWPSRTVRDGAQCAAAVLDDADVDSAGAVAFSGGAPYALAAAATRSDRIDRVDLVSGAVPPEMTEEPPAIQRLLRGMAAATPRLLRGLFRGQAWLARHREPSFVVSQYTAGDATEGIPERAAEVVRADFVEALSRSRRGVVTEFRHAGGDWNVPFDEIDADVCLWHGALDTNVPIAGARRLESALPTATLRVLDDADHLRTLLESVPEILAGYD
ncbi:alpha/beta fold hydrolase [Halobellus limi]|uniref:Alpha/beta hydrolase n=1 Tax=Halobellus limi TaxID=699433 RepID=A0A1H5ZUM9_9EURY|nr:alpha/beta hydrolase [Halobellus limi]QCC47968.1 alpha/beta hydrolase [Halobellus limi]SEG39146.1 Pimeloyl-ACP methyl ester carboxylesterase [Halobellus limi]